MVITAVLLGKFSFGTIFYILGRYGVYIDIESSSVSYVNVMTDLWVKSYFHFTTTIECLVDKEYTMILHYISKPEV